MKPGDHAWIDYCDLVSVYELYMSVGIFTWIWFKSSTFYLCIQHADWLTWSKGGGNTLALVPRDLLARACFSQESSSSAYLVTELLSTPKNLSFSFICKLADLDNWTKPKSCLYSAACIFAAKLAALSHYPCIICRSIECEFLNQAVTVLYLVQTSQYNFSNSHSNYTHLKNSTVLIHFNTCWHLLHGYQAFQSCRPLGLMCALEIICCNLRPKLVMWVQTAWVLHHLESEASQILHQMNFPVVQGLIQIQTLPYRQYGCNRLRNGNELCHYKAISHCHDSIQA